MVTVIIPVFNKSELTKRCLNSLLENSRLVRSVVVINNASKDNTREVLGEFQKRFEGQKVSFTIIHNEKNLGFGSACNRGVRLSQTSYLAILNNDTWLMPAWDEALVNAMSLAGVDEVGPFFDERPWSENMRERAQSFLACNPKSFRKHFVPILMFFKKEAVEKLKFPDQGIFDERFFVTYEDTDLLYRMKALDLKFAQTSLCYIWHQSMGTRSQKGLLPEGYEADGLRIFKEKWGFDPRPADHTFWERLKRRYRKYRSARGLF